jgi:hypothetical protein
MAYDEQNRPLTSDEIRARPTVPATAEMPADARVLLGSYVVESATLRPPEVTTNITPLEAGGGGGGRYRLDVELQGARLPLTNSLTGIATHAGSADERLPRLERAKLGYRPPFHDLRVIPDRLRTPDLPQEWQFLDEVAQPSPRYKFNDRSFPWCAFGRVTAPTYSPSLNSHGTGVMIGPRHLLANNRIVRWNPQGGDAGWIVFTPAYFHGEAPFGTAYAEKVFFWRQLEPLFPTRDEHLLAFDYVVCVLNRRIGDITGWVGWQDTYDPAWNGLPLWSTVAYCDDFANGEEPTFQDQVRVLDVRKPAGTDPPGQALVLENNAKTGVSELFHEPGAPLFGWWHPPEPWPRVVGMHATVKGPESFKPPVDWGPSLAAGGLPLSWLIEHARAAFP